VGHEHVRALFDERSGGGCAQAGRAARHDEGLVLELHTWSSIPADAVCCGDSHSSMAGFTTVHNFSMASSACSVRLCGWGPPRDSGAAVYKSTWSACLRGRSEQSRAVAPASSGRVPWAVSSPVDSLFADQAAVAV